MTISKFSKTNLPPPAMGHDSCRCYSVKPLWATAVGIVAPATVVAHGGYGDSVLKKIATFLYELGWR
jgi:hypothetical protein